MGAPLRVFVSSTYLDNVDRREIVRDAIQRADMLPVGMETWTAAAQPVVDECLAKVRGCDLFVCIIAHRYGFEPPAAGRSLTELEYDEAKKRGLPCYVFLADSTTVDLAADIDQGPERWDKQKRLDAFKARVSAEQTTAFFTDATLSGQIVQALMAYTQERSASPSRAAQQSDSRPKARVRGSAAPSGVADQEIQSYLEQLQSEHSSVTLAGFETRVRVPIRLEDLYVPLRASIDLRLQGDSEFGDATEAATAFHADASEIPLAEAFGRARRLGRRGLILLGDPGSGKTTQLKRLLLSIARHGPVSVDLPAGAVPVFVPLRDLASAQGKLDELVLRQLRAAEVRANAGFAKRLLKRGNLVFLIDGLDEVPVATQRAAIARQIEKLLTTYPESHVAVTCRYAGYKKKERLDASFLELHLHPFTREQSEDFIHKWYEVVETSLAADVIAARAKARRTAEELVEHLRAPEFRAQRVLEMTRNPLLLTAVCLVHRDRGRLPERRVALYEECIKVLLELWRDAKRLRGGIDAERARRVLQPMALNLHEQQATRASAKELAPILAAALGEIRWRGASAPDFLAAIRDESGLLTGWSGDVFGFMHQGFQEYLAARELRTRSFSDPGCLAMLAKRFGDPWWQEVTLLLLSLEDPSVVEPFFRELLEHDNFAKHDAFLELCLSEAPQIPAQTFLAFLAAGRDEKSRWDRQLTCLRALRQLGVELPLELLLELERHSDPRIVELVTGRVLDVAASPAHGRLSAYTPVAHFSTPRGECQLVQIPAGRFLMGSSLKEIAALKEEFPRASDQFDREGPQHEVIMSSFYLSATPVTNEQYGCYLAANPGAAEPKFWSDRGFNQPRQPVVGVSWDEAQACCNWLGGDLPTEAQWEYACRAGMQSRFSSGNKDEDLARLGWYAANSENRLRAVAEKPANPWGLFDMHGNVWEWCRDWHGAYPSTMQLTVRTEQAMEPEVDPPGPTGGSGRVMRGGGFGSVASRCRSAFRDRLNPGDRRSLHGFRVALPAAPSSD